MFLNRGRFRLNGGCGYVLKPIGLRDGRKLRDPNTSRIKKRERTLTVNIISGWQLPKVNTQARPAPALLSVAATANPTVVEGCRR